MVDHLPTQMKNQSVATVALPEKRTPGSNGVRMEFKTNLTALKLKPNVPFYKYDIRMYLVYETAQGKEFLKEITKQTKDDFPEQERKSAAVAVYKSLCKNYDDVFPRDGYLLYDRAAVLFSVQEQLKLGAEEKTFTMRPDLVPNCGDALSVRVVIKKATDEYQLTSNDLPKAVNVRDIERDKGILEVLNLAISQKAYLDTTQFVTYGSGVHYLYDHHARGFRDSELPFLMDGKYVGVGVNKSVKVLEGDSGKTGSAFVVTDVTKGAFHVDDQNLVQKISEMAIFFDRRSGQSTFSVSAAMQPSVMKQILQGVKGLYVRTTYGKKRTFPIGNLAAAANTLEFQTIDGKQCTVEQYFQNHYNIRLKYPGLFTVSERHNPFTYYPAELLVVAPSQRVTMQQQNPDQVAAMIKASATLPQNRLQQTQVMKDALDISNRNPHLKASGVAVDGSFIKVKGRVLPTPKIIYGGQQALKPTDNCKWAGDRAQFIEPAQLSNWAVCVTLTQNDARRLKVEEYVRRVEHRCRLHGMQVEPCGHIFYMKKQDAELLTEWFATQKKMNRRYLMFITSDVIKQHDFIKLLEVQYQIVTQEVKSSKVGAVMFKNQNQTLDNVIAKINMKLGGLNYVVHVGPNESATRWLTDKDRLFVGFEISNPPPLSKGEIDRGATYKMPSVLGWGANCGSNPQHFMGDYLYIEARQSDMMGAKLKELIVEILGRFRAARNLAPKHIILYFSAISEGQYSLVADTYVRAVREGILSFSPNYKTSLTALVVSKDHNERIYRSIISGSRAMEQNIPPGSIVDTTIVSPVINEFFLNSHSAFQGTAKTPKFSMVADDSGIPLNAIEGMTHGLCFLHEIVTSTVSVPVPLIIADRCAKRGHNVYISNLSQKDAVSSIMEANERLVNHGDLKKVRYNA